MDVFQNQSPVPEAVSSIWKVSTFGLMKILTTIAIVLYFLLKSAKPLIRRLYFIPPSDFREVVKGATESKNGAIKKSRVGIKISSLRRRIIMGSKCPQSYSTLPLNSYTVTNKPVDNTEEKYYMLRVNKMDREEKDRFLMNIKPIDSSNINRRKLFGFFHPFSYASGGGEKVLWEAVISTLETDSNNIVVIYTFTGEKDASVFSILNRVKNTFGIDFFTKNRQDMRDRIVFIHLPDKYQWLIKGESYKFLSIIGQAIGSILLVLIGFYQITPDVYIDTIGIPFTYFLVHSLFGLPIISYIHYPTVSRDMLKTAKLMSGLRGFLKYYYWLLLLKLYAFNIMWCDITLFNSTWTAENVQAALGWDDENDDEDLANQILYPPCVCYDDDTFDTIDLKKMISKKRKSCITYVAQFRPEKRHMLLISAYKKYLKNLDKKQPYSLVLIGSLRSDKDKVYVAKLKVLITELAIPEDNIKFIFNASNDEVDRWLSEAEFGINCMWKEHFGIAVVECMLHGQIPLVHASAGPLEDIVIPRINGKAVSNKEMRQITKIEPENRTGLFFKDQSDPDFDGSVLTYPALSEMLLAATSLTNAEKEKMKENAVLVAREKFGRGTFSARWKQYIYEITVIEEKVRNELGKVERVY